MMLLAACSNGTSAVPSLATGPDRLAGDKSPAALMRIADATRAGGDPASAIGLYRRAHELAPQDATPLARLGASYAEMRSYTEAVEAYGQAQALAPQDPEVQRGLGAVLLAVGKPELALSQLNEALARQKNDPRLYSLVGVAYDQLGRHSLAQQTYLAGLQEAPDNRPLRNNLGLSQALSGDFGAATRTLSEAVAGPKSSARARQNLALVYGLAGDTDKAAMVARNDLDEASVKNNLAYYALLRGMDDRARAAAIIGGRVPADGVIVPEPVPAAQPGDGPAALPKQPAVVTTPLPLPTTPEPRAEVAPVAGPPPKTAPRRAVAAASQTHAAVPPVVPDVPASEPHVALELPTPHAAQHAVVATPASAVVTPPHMPNNMPATATQAAPKPSATHDDTPVPDAIAATQAPAAAKAEQTRDAAPPIMPDVPATRARSAPEPLARPIDARLPDAVAPIANSAPVGAMAGQMPDSASLVMSDAPAIAAHAAPEFPAPRIEVPDAVAATPGTAVPAITAAAASAPVALVEPIAVQDAITQDTAVRAPASSNIAPSRPAPAANQTARGAVFIQVGAFHEADRAEKLCGGLAAKGYGLAVAAQPSKTGRNWYICRSTAAADRAQAGALAARLRDEEKTPALLVPVEPSATTPN